MTLSEIAENLKREKSVAIFCHIRPDGDTIGSGLALKKALEKLGIFAALFCEETIPDRFLYLDGVKDFHTEYSGNYTAFFAVDCADYTRLGAFEKTFREMKNTYNVDHHVSNLRFAKYNCVLEEAANCENIYDLINVLGVEIDRDIADALATGIMTDTGNFRHKNVTPKTLRITADLVEKGADLNRIAFYMFTAQSKERAALFGRVMCDIRYYLDGKLAIVPVTKKDVEKTGARPDETEGFVDFIMGIDGVEVGITLLEMDGRKFKASIRSKKADVNGVAKTFGGGGHTLASGCQIAGELEEVIDKLRYAVFQHLPE